MINGISKAYESTKVNNDIRKNNFRGKEIEKVDNHVYNPNLDYSFIDLDRLITAVIERYLGGVVGDGFDITFPDYQNDAMNKEDLKFSKEFFDTINPLIQSAYEKKSLGDVGYHKYEEYIAKKVLDIALVAKEVVKEFSNASNQVTYDEHSLRKSADDYFMEEMSKSDTENMDAESVVDKNDKIHDTAKFRIMSNKECRSILAELKTLI